MKYKIGLWSIIGLALFAGACSEPSSRSAGMFGADSPSRTARGSGVAGHEGDPGSAEGAIQHGTDSFLASAAFGANQRSQAIVVPSDGETVELALVNASVEAAAQAILSETLHMNYVVSPQVTGRVTLQTTGAVPKAVLLELFETSLAAIGAQIRSEGNIARIVPGTSGNSIFRVAGQGVTTEASIVVAPLKYISSTEMVKLLQPLTDQGLKVVAEQRRNLLLLSGPSQILDASLDALNLFDVNVLAGKSVALVPLRSADPEAIVSELQQILETGEGGMLNGVVEFIPNARLGSVLIVSSRAIYLDEAKRWILDLDRTAGSQSEYLATYELQNRSATEVAPILNDLLQESAATPSSGSSEGQGSHRGARVAADDSRNALVVMARLEEHEQIEELLAILDSEARQVLLEATIVEVTLNDEMAIGTRWFFESGNWGVRFSDLSNGAVAGTSPGFSAIFGVGGIEVALNALAGITDVKIISAPTLMVLDNKEGILQIGDQVPVATSSSTSAESENAPIVTQIDYRDTGIILRVKPRIGNSGRVILDISQEVSNVTPNRVSGIDSPTIRQRRVQTSVALGDGQTLALGGLVQESDNVGSTETPGLGRIPLLGNLFRMKNSSKARTELLILIRPRVVNDAQAAVAATEYWRSRLSNTNSLLQTGLGSARHTITDYIE